MQALLERLEAGDLGDPLPVLAYVAGQRVEVDDGELNEARRRAVTVLAAGGDPHRELDHDSIAAERLAAELDTPERRLALSDALDVLADEADGLDTVTEALDLLRSEPDLAWRSLALALLADELAEE